jgi:TonB family protein
MLRLSKLFLFSISILVLSSWLYPEDAYLVRVRVYQGKVMEDVPSEKNEALWRTSQEPLLSSLVDVVAAPDPEWSANVTKVLFDLADLETLSELFSVSRGWDGRSRDWLDRFLGSDVVFRLETSARKGRIQDFSIRATLFRSKEGVIPKDESLETRARRALESGSNPKKMDKIFENALELSLDDPVVFRSPLEGGALFVVVAVTKNIGQTKKEVSKTSKSGLEIVESQRPLGPIQPYYPDSLRERRIEGKVGLLIAIDKSGAVIGTRVTQSLHPYLDYSVVQAVIQERFPPVLKNGKPVEAVFPYEYRFEHLANAPPGRGEQPDGKGVTDSGRLATVLAGSADYCQSLSESIHYYDCEQTNKEI